MRILEERTQCNRPPASGELHVEMSKALNEAKRLRRRIRRLLAEARGRAGSERGNCGAGPRPAAASQAACRPFSTG